MQTPAEELYTALYDTPLGSVVAVASGKGVRRVGFEVDLVGQGSQVPSPALDAFEAFLRAYLARSWGSLPTVPLDLVGPPADLTVWEQVSRIGPGHSISYGDLATRVGRPSAARAVGASVGRNPALILVPCHRVIASNGSLQGYAGGVSRKAWLLRHEGVLLL